MSEVMTVSEVAAYLRLSDAGVYKGLNDGRIPGHKFMGRWRIFRDELEARMRADGARQAPQRRPLSSFDAKVIALAERRAS